MGLGVGKLEAVTERVSGLLPGVGIAEEEEPGRDSGVSGMSGSAFLVFAIGSAGRGPDGGANGGGAREGRCGMVEVMVAVADVDIALLPEALHCLLQLSAPDPTPSR